MQTINTNINGSYVLTVLTAPVTVNAVLDNGDSIELLNAESKGQYGFVSVSGIIEVSQDDAIVSPTRGFSGALSGSASGGGGNQDFFKFNNLGEIASYKIDAFEDTSNLFYFRKFQNTEMECDLPKVTFADSMFYGSNLTKIKLKLDSCPSINYLFNDCTSLMEVDLSVSSAGSAKSMFSNCYTLNKATAVLSSCTSGIQFFKGAECLVSANIVSPNLVTATEFFADCTMLSSVIMDRGKISNADMMHFNNGSLRTIETGFPSLSTGFNAFKNAGLNEMCIDMILESLPSYSSGTHRITFTGCPGADACEPSIGSNKGWTVQL